MLVTFSDDTSLRPAAEETHLPRVYVQCTLPCRADDAAAAHLRAKFGERRGPVKWDDVRGWLVEGLSPRAMAVRAKLEEAVIMVVDPLAFYRSIDLTWGGHRGKPILYSRALAQDPAANRLRRFINRRVARVLLISSGAEAIHSLLRSPLIGEGFEAVGGRASRESSLAALDPFHLAAKEPKLNTVSRIALQTTALVSHEHDPDARRPLIEGVSVYGMAADGYYNQRRLEAIAHRSVVFDRGHEDATQVSIDFHRAAQRRLANSPLSMSGLDGTFPNGLVRTGDTAMEIELQMADIAVGWASHVLQEWGALELNRRFRCVLYNGIPLDRADAERLDTEKRFHRRAVERAGH